MHYGIFGRVFHVLDLGDGEISYDTRNLLG
jgi:hypothetical protein